MEILPILSTIILVGTVATLILAVAAYVLYKLRERKARALPTGPAVAPQPYVLTAPAQQSPRVPHRAAPPPAPQHSPSSPQPEQPAPDVSAPTAPPTPVFFEYTPEGYVPAAPGRPRRAPTPPAGDRIAWR